MKRLLIGFALLLGCAAVVMSLIPPSLSPHTSKSTLILNRLRALDAAKSAWAAEHSDAKGKDPVEHDLVPYLQQLHHNTYFMNKPVAGETYSIHGLTEPAEAQLTKGVDEFPASASVRWGPDGDIQVRTNRSLPWPNKRVETNRRPALPIDVGQKFESVVCAPPFLSAAVAHPYR